MLSVIFLELPWLLSALLFRTLCLYTIYIFILLFMMYMLLYFSIYCYILAVVLKVCIDWLSYFIHWTKNQGVCGFRPSRCYPGRCFPNTLGLALNSQSFLLHPLLLLLCCRLLCPLNFREGGDEGKQKVEKFLI